MSVAQKSPSRKPAEPTASPPTRSASRSGKKNVEIVKHTYEAFNRGNIRVVLEALDPKIEWREPSGSLPPPAGGGLFRGRDAVEKEIFGSIPQTWRELKLEPEAYLDAGEHVVVTGRFRARPKAGGAEVEAACVQIWTVRDGKVVRMQNYTDTARLAHALEA